ncbi:conserved hypothetical protein [Ricinus communis]|uniref:Uncharacterized protein n=1 Tax=Ricinus communis TaxID=3988 RepID=B9SRF7_RICCO|nr:conserved hypothetical protein [Ricinus communis]
MEGKSGSINVKEKGECCYFSETEVEEEEEDEDPIGISLHKLNLGPKKKLLVLSLGVLCQKIRAFKKDRPKNCSPDATYGSILGQEECTDSGFKSLENINKPLFLKELRKLWESSSSSLGQYSSSNTLLIDDKPYKALLNSPNAGVFLDEYKAGQANDTVLGREGGLWIYLDGLAKADDVHTYVKNHPFGQPAITAMRPDWDYYSKIVHRQSKE